MAEPQLLLNYTGHLPECPTWSAEEQALYWADILEGDPPLPSADGGTHRTLFPRGGGVSRCVSRVVLSLRCERVSG
jgi:sugar lactone lactonase YvrE